MFSSEGCPNLGLRTNFLSSSPQEVAVNSTHFIGLLVDESSYYAKKILTLRQMYDPKFFRIRKIQFPLVAPFQCSQFSVSSMVEEIKEELETFLFGFEKGFSLQVNGLDYSFSKNHLLYFRPELSTDLIHLKESLKALLKNYTPSAASNKKNGSEKKAWNDMIVLGQFPSAELMNEALDRVREFFPTEFLIDTSEIVLFEKRNHMWIVKETLFGFKDHEDSANLNYGLGGA